MTMMDRRGFLRTAAAAAVFLGGTARAQWQPSRPINIIVPYKAGGGVDLYARAFAKAAKDILPVPVVIVNRPGAGGMTGAIAAAKARADGGTFLLHSAGSFVLRHLFADTDVGPFESFRTIAQIGNLKASVAVPSGSAHQSIADLAAAAKAAPGKLRWGHNGRGGVFHVLGQTFLNNSGLQAADVPFKGGAALRAALIGAQVDFAVIGIQQGRGFEEQMRILAVADDMRDELAADVPTFAEQGFDIPLISSPIILFAPKGIDDAIAREMEAKAAQITAAAGFAETIKTKGTLPLYRNGDDAERGLREIARASQPVIDAQKS